MPQVSLIASAQTRRRQRLAHIVCRKTMMRRWFAGLRQSGKLYTWGDSFHTLLGHETSQKLVRPKLVPNVTAVDVFTGPGHTLVLTPEETLLSFGYNDHGELGTGSTAPVTTPQPVVSLEHVKTAACGQHYSLAVTEEGDLYHWGFPGRGRGFLARLIGKKVREEQIVAVPRRMQEFSSAAMVDVAAGTSHFLALSSTPPHRNRVRLLLGRQRIRLLWYGRDFKHPPFACQSVLLRETPGGG